MKTLLILSALFFSIPAIAGDDEAFITKDATKHDFSEYMLNGKMKAPNGFFLQGKKGQSLSQMVRLRSNFKRDLRNSKSAMKHGVR